jgi:hypothetical protein
LGRERVLLAESAHRDGAIALDGAAEIAFHELAVEMQGTRIGVSTRPCGIVA